MSRLMLHFNYHYIHHLYPKVPWNQLPDVFNRENRQFDAPYFRAALRQLKGPLPL